MIPPFDQHGLLPPGCHTCKDWDDFAAVFAYNGHREAMLVLAKSFIRDRLTPLARGLRLIVGGSFLSDKDHPGDIDIVVIIPMLELGARQELLNLFVNEGRKDPIWDNHKVEFYIHIEGLGSNNLALFFEYVGEKSAEAKGLQPKDKRGTLEIESWTLG